MGDRTAPVPWSAALPLVSLVGRRPLFSQAALAVSQAVLPLAGLVAMQQLIDAVALGVSGRVATDLALQQATLATGFAALVALLGSGLRSLASVIGENHGRRLSDAATLRVQAHAAALDLADFDRPAFHELLQRAGTEASQRPVRLVQDGLSLLVALVGLATMAFWLGSVSPWLPLLVGAAALPVAWMRRRHAHLRVLWQEHNVQTQREAGYAGAVLTGRATGKDVRVLGVGPWFADRLAQLRANLRDSLGALARRRGRDELLVSAISSAGLFAAYYLLAVDALAGGLSLGELVLQAQAAQRAQNGVRDLLAALAGVREHRQFLVPVVEFLARQPSLPASRQGAAQPLRTPPPGPLALAAEAISFRYPEAKHEALAALTCTIGAGERVAIVGANGSGKSTLVKLLARLYTPSAGRLLANGVDLRAWEPEAFRARLSVLLQDAALFELSVRENLALGNPRGVAERDLWQALALVGLADAVRQLPAGLDTACSRRVRDGVDWSFGQGRRLLLARALVAPADLLLLDEPFAALDPSAAAALAATLAALPRHQTLLVVDHRLECLRFCDRVLALRSGHVLAFGRPHEVAAADPSLAALGSA